MLGNPPEVLTPKTNSEEVSSLAYAKKQSNDDIWQQPSMS